MLHSVTSIEYAVRKGVTGSDVIRDIRRSPSGPISVLCLATRYSLWETRRPPFLHEVGNFHDQHCIQAPVNCHWRPNVLPTNTTQTHNTPSFRLLTPSGLPCQQIKQSFHRLIRTLTGATPSKPSPARAPHLLCGGSTKCFQLLTKQTSKASSQVLAT